MPPGAFSGQTAQGTPLPSTGTHFHTFESHDRWRHLLSPNDYVIYSSPGRPSAMPPSRSRESAYSALGFSVRRRWTRRVRPMGGPDVPNHLFPPSSPLTPYSYRPGTTFGHALPVAVPGKFALHEGAGIFSHALQRCGRACRALRHLCGISAGTRTANPVLTITRFTVSVGRTPRAAASSVDLANPSARWGNTKAARHGAHRTEVASIADSSLRRRGFFYYFLHKMTRHLRSCSRLQASIR